MESVRLAVDLQEGFAGGSLDVLVDGDVIGHFDAVRSHPLTGFAATVSADVERGRHEVVIVGDDIGELRHVVDARRDVFLGVDASTREVIAADHPFGYG